MENPKNTLRPIVDPHLDPGGRPPDPMIQMGLPAVLERSDSPAALEDQREPKKNKNSGVAQGDGTLDGESMAMEADLEADTNGISVQRSVGGDSAPQQVGLNSGKASYASMVTQGLGRAGHRFEEDVLSPDNVIVLDEDCIISDSGDYPTIKFSDRVHDQIDRSMMNVLITEKANSQGMGDGVTTMDRNEQEKGTRSAAYRKSSPSRRVKDTANNSGEHIAYSIQEKNRDGRNSIRDRFYDRSTNRGKGFKEVNAKGLKIRKTVDVHSPHRVLLSDWVQLASNQLHLAAESSRARLDTGHAMEEDGREAVSPRPLLGSEVDICGELDATDRGDDPPL
ncbi:hypothetical protein V6N12_057240 [Hibiscus sabdariffa]|uniref:Uncharacterized protein n=1 Tax=Hibiscus sabdariffa TaxID=183260 RepID=A0ABR2DBA4_9ROSI